jgi:putative PIN family toxin of toxin-antitoxin system
MCISPAVVTEYEEVLRRPRFKFSIAQIDNTLDLIRGTSRLVHPIGTLRISAHDSDNRFYECAEAAEADYLITGNTSDFPKDHGPTKIITPRNFVNQVVSRLPQGGL